MTGISERLNEPFVTGGPSIPGDGSALPVSIDGRSYLVDTSRNTPMQERFRRQPVQLLNSQQNIDKGESALTTPEVWRRTYQSWHHGMGQKVADREDSDPFRYDWSKGINPWERWEISLLHDTEKVAEDDFAEGLIVNGCTVMLSADRLSLKVESATASTTFAFPFSLQHWVSSDGYTIYALGSDRMLRTYKLDLTPTTVTVTLVTAKTTGIPAGETVSLLLLLNFKAVACTTAGKVYDVTKSVSEDVATATAVYAMPTPDVSFIAGCAGRRSIFLMARSGSSGKTFVHMFDISRPADDAPLDTLLYSGVAAELPDGEKGRALYSYLGYIAIGTDKGFRFSVVGEGITYGPLIETPGPVTAFEGQGKFLYYALSGFDGNVGIGRADLSEFIAPLQPTYASDLMSSEDSDDPVTFIVTTPSGKMRFGTAGSGVWQETDTYVDEGKIVLSRWTFNVVDTKIGLYITTQTSDGTGGGGTLSALYGDSTNPVPLGSYIDANQKFDLSGYPFDSVALQGTLTANPANTNTPKAFAVELRATYARGKASEWQVPCILHDEVEMDNGAVVALNVVDDYDHLMSLYESGRPFLYVEDGRQWTVNATDFVWSPQERSTRSGWQGVFTLYFREIR